MSHARPRPKCLAEKLLKIRKALGLSQKEMAKRLSERSGTVITHKNISRYEHNKSVPYLELALAYARVANVDINQIVDEERDLNLRAGSELIVPDVGTAPIC